MLRLLSRASISFSAIQLDCKCRWKRGEVALKALVEATEYMVLD